MTLSGWGSGSRWGVEGLVCRLWSVFLMNVCRRRLWFQDRRLWYVNMHFRPQTACWRITNGDLGRPAH